MPIYADPETRRLGAARENVWHLGTLLAKQYVVWPDGKSRPIASSPVTRPPQIVYSPGGFFAYFTPRFETDHQPVVVVRVDRERSQRDRLPTEEAHVGIGAMKATTTSGQQVPLYTSNCDRQTPPLSHVRQDQMSIAWRVCRSFKDSLPKIRALRL